MKIKNFRFSSMTLDVKASTYFTAWKDRARKTIQSPFARYKSSIDIAQRSDLLRQKVNVKELHRVRT